MGFDFLVDFRPETFVSDVCLKQVFTELSAVVLGHYVTDNSWFNFFEFRALILHQTFVIRIGFSISLSAYGGKLEVFHCPKLFETITIFFLWILPDSVVIKKVLYVQL